MTIRAFGRLRVANAAPIINPSLATALKVGEIVASRQGALYLGIGSGTGTNATSYVTFTGSGETSQQQEIGGLIYSDEAAQNGATLLLPRAPTTLTLASLTHRVGVGSCIVQVRTATRTFGPTASVGGTLTTTTLAGSVVDRRVQAGEYVELVVSAATNPLTGLIVQLDWLEG